MRIPKLTVPQWLAVVRALLPILGSLVRVAGVKVVELIRASLDTLGLVESLFSSPDPLDPVAPVPKTGQLKREAFVELMAAAFATADERISEFAEVFGNVADALVPLLNAWGIFRTSTSLSGLRA